MFLQVGRCATCGGKFDDTYRTEKYNTIVDKYFILSDTRLRPYFCSEKCKDNSIGRKEIIKARDQAHADAKASALSLAEAYDYVHEDDDEDDAEDRQDVIRRIADGFYYSRDLTETSFHDELQRKYRKFFDDYAEGAAAVIQQHEASVSTRTVIDMTDQLLPHPVRMSIDFNAIAAVAGLKKLPPRYREYFEIVSPHISSAAYEGSFYSTEANECWGELLRLCIQHLKPLIADTTEEGIYLTSINALQAAPDPYHLLKQAYLLFQSTKNGKPSFSRLHLQKLVRGSPSMSHEELWERVDRSTPPKEIGDIVFGEGAFGPGSILAVPFPAWISNKQRYDHTHILAPTGMGKTVLILANVLADLAKADPPGMIIVDPKGSMVQALSRLEIFHPEHGRLRDRLMILDVTGKYGYPQLNFFAPPRPDLPAPVRKSIEAKTVDLLEYVFSSAEFKLTGKQSIGFSFLARLIFATPNADLMKMFRLIQMDLAAFANSEYPAILEGLDMATQLFFETDFFGEFKETKEQVKARLYMAMETPELLQIFNAPHRSIDWFDCIQKKKIIFVHTGMTQLKDRGSQFFGRYVISSVVSAIFARSEIPKDQWHPTFLWIDEAQLLIDEKKTQEMLSLVREYCLGIALAHQQMTGVPFNDNIRNSISTNTAIKYASGLAKDDLRGAVSDFHCSPEFISSKVKDDTRVNFACFMRNHPYRRAFQVGVPIKGIESQPVMDEIAYQRLLCRNRELVSPIHRQERPLRVVNEEPLPQQSVDTEIELKPIIGHEDDSDDFA